jgi:predicted MFS family arabinose efflux permease
MFAYCNNNPVSKYDPSGHSAILIAIGIGAVLGGIYGGISAAANNQDVVEGVVIGAVVGGLTGLITEIASVPLMLIGTFVVGVGGDVASQMILDEKTFGDVNLISAGWAGVTNAALAFAGKGLSIVDQMNNLQGADKVIFGTMTNSPLMALGMAINMSVSQNSVVYTVNDLLGDILGEGYSLALGR